MRKLLLIIGLMLSPLAFADSNVKLDVPNGGVLAPKGGAISLNMVEAGAIRGVNYSVTCHIHAPDVVLVQIYPGSAKINGENINIHQVATLPAGDSIVIFPAIVSQPRIEIDPTYGVFGFTNLDNTLQVTVTSCTAKPAQ